MKLRNIILATIAMAMCSAAIADNTSAMSQGGTYVGLAGGWGNLSTDGQAVNFLAVTQDQLNPESVVNTASSESGGFSGQVYLGYLMSLNKNSAWLFGPEIGYSYYANNTYTALDWIDNDNTLNIKQSGYGVDFLLNATYVLSDTVMIAVKPGFQYAFDKFTTSNSISSFPSSASTTQILPEINVGANWQAFPNKPFFFGASYQHVWGHSSNNVANLYNNDNITVSSRDMFALNLEYMFH